MPGTQLTATEARLMRWWSDLLPIRPTCVDDDFFDLGGQSMHLIRLMQEVYDRYRVELPITELFGEPFTVARTAALIDRETSVMAPGGAR